MLDEEINVIKRRIETIWQAPNFLPLFQKYAKRTPIRIKKGSSIFYEGDEPNRLYFVKSGFVKLFRVSRAGKDATVYLYGPGSLLAIRALTSKDRALKHSAQAITDVEIITISREDYLSAVSAHPEFLVDLMYVFIERLNYTERKLEGFITADATARVANFLLDCTKRFGIKKRTNIILPFSLTHQLIADFVGSFRETVTVALILLKKEEVIGIDRSKLTIRNIAKLRQYASGKK